MNQLRTLPSYIFLTDDKSRLRAGWRLLIAVFLTGLFFNIVDWIRSARSLSGPTTAIVGEGIDLVVVTGAIYITRRLIDRRPFASLGLNLNKQTVFDILMGIAITFVLMSIIYLIEYSMGWLNFESFAWQVEKPSTVVFLILRYLIVYMLVGWSEELVYRGYILQSLASGFNLTWAIIISSVYFGIEHLSNPDGTWMAAVGIFFIALFFVYGYVRTGQLWLPIGMHIGWNFFQSTVFGFPVSGYDRPGLFQINVSGPEVWTGGGFGPEAGLIILPICLLGALLIHIYTKRREHAIVTKMETAGF
ncbi:MAG: CPBP family intramembrane glutamic endopeptidase [Chloroflexota bacterium]